MARYDQYGSRLPTSLFEAAAWQFVIVASCRRCGHEGVFSAHALWWRFERRHWDSSLRNAARRLRCTKCGAGAFLTWAKDKPVTVVLPMPDEREWKKAVSRFRS